MNKEDIALQAEYLCLAILKLAPVDVSIPEWIEELAQQGRHEFADITAVADLLLWNVRCHQRDVRGGFPSKFIQ